MERVERNPNHHIWCNNGTYFIHVTLHWRGRRKLRLRHSLKTKSVEEARRRRDRFLGVLGASAELRLPGCHERRTRAAR
jgi:hypothetical protein